MYQTPVRAFRLTALMLLQSQMEDLFHISRQITFLALYKVLITTTAFALVVSYLAIMRAMN